MRENGAKPAHTPTAVTPVGQDPQQYLRTQRVMTLRKTKLCWKRNEIEQEETGVVGNMISPLSVWIISHKCKIICYLYVV